MSSVIAQMAVVMRCCNLFTIAALGSAMFAQAQNATLSASLVQRRVELAQKRVRMEPKSAQAYDDLAFAYCRWARDTDDPQLYEKADEGIRQSLQLAPGNYEARKLEVTVLLGKKQAAEALKLASALQIHNHDDISVWGLLVDANIALNKLDEAERDAQWILDLRQGSSLGFTKAAQLRELFGDPEGAIEFYNEALRRTAQGDADERTWLMIQNARLQSKLGNPQRAEALLKQALQLFPDSHLAQAELAKLPGKMQTAPATR